MYTINNISRWAGFVLFFSIFFSRHCAIQLWLARLNAVAIRNYIKFNIFFLLFWHPPTKSFVFSVISFCFVHYYAGKSPTSSCFIAIQPICCSIFIMFGAIVTWVRYTKVAQQRAIGEGEEKKAKQKSIWLLYLIIISSHLFLYAFAPHLNDMLHDFYWNNTFYVDGSMKISFFSFHLCDGHQTGDRELTQSYTSKWNQAVIWMFSP